MKRFVLTLALVSLACSVALAGAAKEEGSGSSAAVVAPAGELPVVKDKITLTYALPEGVQGITANPSNNLLVMQEYEKRTNVHIEWSPIPSSTYNEVMTARLSAGVDLPDMIQSPGGTFADKLARDGTVKDLTELLDKYAPRLKQFWMEHPIEKVKRQYPDGKIYFVGGYVAPDILMPGIMTCKPWMDKLGAKMPETTEEYYTLLKAMRDKDPNGNGQKDDIPLATNLSGLDTISRSFGLQLEFGYNYQVDDKGKVYSDYTSQNYREFLAYVNRLYKEELLTKDFLNFNTSQTAFEYVKKDIVGTMIFWHTWAPRYSSLHAAGDKDGLTPVFIPVAPLAGPKGERYILKRILAESGGFALTQKTKNPEAAVKWFDWVVYSKEAQDLYIWGVEAITYKVENGKKVKIQPTDPTKSWESVLVDIGGRQPAHPHVQSLEGRRAIFPEWVFAYDAEFKKYYKEPFVAGLVAYTEAERDTWNQYSRDVDTYISEMRAKFMTGQEPLSRFDEYVKTLEKIGLPKLLEIRQQQYARYQGIK